MAVHNVCLVGAGNIANTHAAALSAMSSVRVSAVVDPNLDLATAMAQSFGGAKAFGSLEDALAARDFDRAHILVPPPLHDSIATTLLDAGVSVLCEKPLTESFESSQKLIALAAEKNAILGTNQNFLFNPAFRALRERIDSKSVGRLRHVHCVYNMPLRQLAAKQMSHWMFDKPLNILLEQAVHPLSLIRALIGEVSDISTQAPPPLEFSPGLQLYRSCNIALQGTEADAQVHFAVGRDYPFWQVSAVCDDGVVVADIITNRTHTHGRTRFPEFADAFFTGRSAAREIASQSWGNAADYLLSLFRLKDRSDPFYRSMAGSIAAFHEAVDAGISPESDGAFGADLVRLCEEIAASAFTTPPAAAVPVTREPAAKSDVVLLGGTGFIGAHTVRHILDSGRTVTVMARNLKNLAPVFFVDGVSLLRGDVTSEADVKAAVSRAPLVVNLAHGGGGDSWEAIERSMVGSARLVGQACLDAKTERLIQIGSIAGLYLGDERETIIGATPPDPQPDERADYARGKAASDLALLDMHRKDGLPVCILRPGVVVGDGTSPFHSGLGFYNTEQFCLGWNAGENPLPFVLAGDVASAIVGSLTTKGIEGKSYNLVGDVTLSARAFIAALAEASGRPLQFYPQSAYKLQGVDIGKWLIKRAIGRKAPFPSLRDTKSRGLNARFDCADAKADLNWKPVTDRATFVDQAIRVVVRS
ncbi:MAG: NAD-dependent epimerase/dehydratase family protein [Alphaproteobacteria bacterium]|nr:NAD-dependent epimerase/dehydratase family protein [Alphaproteobacteria bacterium]